MGVFQKSVKEKKRDVQVLQIYKWADYTTGDAIGRCDRHVQSFAASFRVSRIFRKIGSCGKTEDADDRKIGSHG
jgi:hypothetical protein